MTLHTPRLPITSPHSATNYHLRHSLADVRERVSRWCQAACRAYATYNTLRSASVTAALAVRMRGAKQARQFHDATPRPSQPIIPADPESSKSTPQKPSVIT